MLIDAHAHLDQYDPALLPWVLQEIKRLEVFTVSVAMDPPSYTRTCALAAGHPWILPTFGIHPWQASAYVDRLDALQPLMDASPMFGEIGLDFHWVEDRTAYAAQRTVLRFFLEAARGQGKIANLHTKGAEDEVLELLHDYAIERAIIHWYSGPPAIARALAARGAYFTIGVELHSSPLIQELATSLPLTRLLTETDNPSGVEWLTGEVGMPSHLSAVISGLARLRGVDEAELQEVMRQNMLRLLGDDIRLAAVSARLTGGSEPDEQRRARDGR